jgi:DNA-binding transcriptional LysR family regulator
VRHIPLELTYAGEVFWRYALEIQKKKSAMLQELGDIAHNEKGRLRIGIAHTRGHTIMPGIILAFQQRYPLVQVQLVEATNDELHTKLTGGEIDLAIANFHERLPGVELEDFYQEEVILLVADL